MGELTFGSVFAGVGGFDLGLEMAGWTLRWQVENDKWCRQVLRRHWPEDDVRLYGDVNDVEGSDLAPVDLLCGGFPCQGVSVAGHRRGLADERSALFHQFVRLTREVAPRWILLENVPGLLSSADGRDFQTVLSELTGYYPQVPDGGWRTSGVCQGPDGRAIWRVLDSQYFAVPQRRRRVFLVVDTARRCSPEVLLEPEGLPGDPRAVQGAREDVPGRPGGRPTSPGARGGRRVANRLQARDHKGPLPSRQMGTVVYRKAQKAHHPEDGERWEPTDRADTLDAIGHAPRTAHMVFNWQNWTRNGFAVTRDHSSPLDTSQTKAVVPTPRAIQNARATNPGQGGIGVADEGDPAYTLTGRDDPGVTHLVPRRLTPLECERLQGFPDDWTEWGISEEGEPVDVSDTQRYRKMGNAVTVPVAAWVASRIVAMHARNPV